MLELDRRTDRILPNGWCLLPPRQVCVKGNACLTCDKFATDATFLPELQTQMARTGQLIDDRRATFKARTGQDMGEDNVWLAGRRQEHDALSRIILKLETHPARRRHRPGRPGRRGPRPHRCHHRRTRARGHLMRGNPDNLRQAAARKSAAARSPSRTGPARDDPPQRADHLPRPGPDRRRLPGFPLPPRADPPTRRTPAGTTAEHPATGATSGSTSDTSEQRRAHPHRPTRRAQTTTPRRGPPTAAGPRNRPGRDPRAAPPSGPPPCRALSPSIARHPLVIPDQHRGPRPRHHIPTRRFCYGRVRKRSTRTNTPLKIINPG